MQFFFAFNLEKFTPDRIFYTGSARGARDKYEVWEQPICTLVTFLEKDKIVGKTDILGLQWYKTKLANCANSPLKNEESLGKLSDSDVSVYFMVNLVNQGPRYT